jgi:microcystin-dependent protein
MDPPTLTWVAIVSVIILACAVAYLFYEDSKINSNIAGLPATQVAIQQMQSVIATSSASVAAAAETAQNASAAAQNSVLNATAAANVANGLAQNIANSNTASQTAVQQAAAANSVASQALQTAQNAVTVSNAAQDALKVVIANDAALNSSISKLSTTMTTYFGAAQVPIGTIIPSAIPSTDKNMLTFGFLTCQGQAVAVSAYPDLYAAIGNTYGKSDGNTFYLPDLRGTFLRGAGGNSSAYGMLQLDGIKSHIHAGTTTATGNHTHAVGVFLTTHEAGGYGLTKTGGFADRVYISGGNINSGSSGNHSHAFTTDGGAGALLETRPQNIAMDYYIKAFVV